MKRVDKKCRSCENIMKDVFIVRNFCDECNRKKYVENRKRPNRNKSPKYTDEDYRNNFNLITELNNHILTAVGFDEVSKIQAKSYKNFYKGKNWVDIVDYFGKKSLLYNYVKNEFIKFHEGYKKANISKFIENHKYISYNLLIDVGRDKILDELKLKITRYTDDDYSNNFNDITLKLGRVPLFMEFEKYTQIPIESYVNRYKIKGKIYDKVVKMYANKSQYDEYLKNRLKNKKDVGTKNSKTPNAKIARERIRKDQFKNGTAPCSKPQKSLHEIIGGELNYPFGVYSLDIAFPEEKIDVEYDGGAHDKAVKIGRITHEEFKRLERIRWYSLNRKKWREIRIISERDRLPSKKNIEKMIGFAKEYLNSGHSWIHFNIDTGKMINSTGEYDYDFGELKTSRQMGA